MSKKRKCICGRCQRCLKRKYAHERYIKEQAKRPFGLGPKVLNVLTCMELTSIQDFASCSRYELAMTPGIGKKTLARIEQLLQDNSLHLRDDTSSNSLLPTVSREFAIRLHKARHQSNFMFGCPICNEAKDYRAYFEAGEAGRG